MVEAITKELPFNLTQNLAKVLKGLFQELILN